MMHRNEHHSSFVNTCRISKSGNCRFGEHCWYKHRKEIDDMETSTNVEPPNMIKRLFDMMEKIADRMNVRENQNQ